MSSEGGVVDGRGWGTDAQPDRSAISSTINSTFTKALNLQPIRSRSTFSTRSVSPFRCQLGLQSFNLRPKFRTSLLPKCIHSVYT